MQEGEDEEEVALWEQMQAQAQAEVAAGVKPEGEAVGATAAAAAAAAPGRPEAAPLQASPDQVGCAWAKLIMNLSWEPPWPPVPAVCPTQVAAGASARLPAEPAESDPCALRVALRLPTGARLQRRFLGTDTVQVTLSCHYWCALCPVPACF